MKISVLMVVRNEQAYILETLRSLKKQTLKPYEVLVIDHQSTDSTYQILKDFQKNHSDFPLEVWQREENNLGRSRAELVRRSKGPVLGFTDGDCKLPKDWLQTLSHLLSEEMSLNPKVAGVGGPNRLPSSTHIHQAINLALDTALGWGGSPQALKPRQPLAVDHLPTTNALLLKEAVLFSGNFSDDRIHGGEDLDLGWKMSAHGYQLILSPQPVVTNCCADNFNDWLFRMYRFGELQASSDTSIRPAKKSQFALMLILPGFLVFMTMAFFFTPAFQFLIFALLLSMTGALVVTGIKGHNRLAVPYWLTILLSPTFYSMGFWKFYLTQLLIRIRKGLAADVFSHLKPRPLHALGQMISLLKRLIHS